MHISLDTLIKSIKTPAKILSHAMLVAKVMTERKNIYLGALFECVVFHVTSARIEARIP